MNFFNQLFMFAFVASLALTVGCSNEDEKVLDGQGDEETQEQESEYDESYIKYSDYVVVDFDALYGKCSGADLVANLESVISKADPYYKTMVLLKSANYDFENNGFSVTNSVLLTGVIPDSVDNEERGAQGVTTTLSNISQTLLKKANITVANLKIVDNSTSTYGTVAINASGGMLTQGIVFYNVEIENGSVQLLGRYGAGVTCQNCTFNNFTSSGYAANRSQEYDEMPKCEFHDCLYYPNESLANYNTRGVTFDAGNTEYPIIWDLQGTTIDNCLFYRNGVGYSRCCNSKVTNCDFYGNTLWRDMVHTEEFTNDILIEGNTFVHETQSRTFYIDRERQNASNISIINNTFKGDIGWIISSYSPSGIIFEGNDFSEAKFNTGNGYNVFEFSYYGNESESEYVPYEVPTTGLSMKNNIGLTGFTLNLFVEEGDTSNVIEESGAITATTVPAIAPIIADGKYKLKSKSGQYVAISSTGSLVTTAVEADAEVWDIAFYELQNYTVLSTSTGYYFETPSIYTLSDMQSTTFSTTYYVYQTRNYAGKSRVPFFYFQERGDDEYIIYPGGNEEKSRVVTTNGEGDQLALEMPRPYINGVAVTQEPDDECTWTLVSVE
ncbi:MAG: hypothetical protein SNH01_06915 [Rikenellaceae bacterium]